MNRDRPPDPAAFAPGSADAAGPAAVPPEPDESSAPRAFEIDGRRWIARLAGRGALGTGACGLGLVEAVHFFDAEIPDRPLFEALLAAGRFLHLFDRELAELLAKATPIVRPDGG